MKIIEWQSVQEITIAEKCTLMRGQYLRFEPLDFSQIFICCLKPSYSKYQRLDWENIVWFKSYTCLFADLSRDSKKQCFAEKCTLMRGQYLGFEPLDFSKKIICFLKPNYAKYQRLDWVNLVWFESYRFLSTGLSRRQRECIFLTICFKSFV